MNKENIKIPFSQRAHQYTAGEVNAVVDVMCNAVTLTQGDHQQSFEKRFREYADVEHAFAVSNGTMALELTAQLCQFRPGDEVIIPSHTFTSSAYPFVKAGARIVWADIELSTRVVSAETIAQCITSNSRAIVVPHLYGFGADMPAIMKLAIDRDLIVIEDAAQALGAMVDRQMVGTFGNFGVYSFHSHKNITTLGEGGMLTVRDPKIAEIIPMLRHNGHCPYLFDRPDYWIPAMGNLDLPSLRGEPVWPTNCCIGEVECALGVKLLDRIDEINEEKRDRALKFIDTLEEYPELVFHREDSSRHNYHLLAAEVKANYRDGFIRRMLQHHGIQCAVQYYPLNRYPFYEKLGFGTANCPNADSFFDNMVSFPFHHLLTNEEIRHISVACQETMGHLIKHC
jgi:dTDP-4-amino-4,6-dideoxygalactose transaminase